MAKWKSVKLAGGGPSDGQSVTVPQSWDAYRPWKASGAYLESDTGVWRWKPDGR